MAQTALPPHEPASPTENHPPKSLWRRLLGRSNGASGPAESLRGHELDHDDLEDDPSKPGLIRRVSRKVVPGLPRAQTFKRQQSELRNNLEPVKQTPAERRAVSVDRRLHASQTNSQCQSNPRTSAPDFHMNNYSTPPSVPSLPASPISEKMATSIGDVARLDAPSLGGDDPAEKLPEEPPPDGETPDEDHGHAHDTFSQVDAASMTTSQYDQMIHDELERIWILNLSMHFRDKSKREKFFVTYRERDKFWRRVTISLDYRGAPENSLEMDLIHTKFQRDKNAKIYEAIRESLVDIQFYDTVTNLKLQTTDGRLHVHVVEDVNEIIHYPTIRMIQHLGCRKVRESDIEFDSHMSGFVYKVSVNGRMLIKKEIPGPDTVDEFLYEVNALNRLRHSRHVIEFYGVIVDDQEEVVKGLLISYAEQGALIDIIYDHDHSLPWATREKWARQIIQGLSEIHEAGFVQGDFTLSNIVIDNDDNAKIIDINRRGCPVGWEPPEATPLIESNQRISMYIGVKSDLYQLGMVLWALAMQEDEPESYGRPLRIDDEVNVPHWYRTIVDTCLADDPRLRAQAIHLLNLFPAPEVAQEEWSERDPPLISVGDASYPTQEYSGNGVPQIKTVQPPSDWSYVNMGHTYIDPPSGISNEPYYYPTRGRSPPSPLPSNQGCDSPGHRPTWPSYSYGHGHDRGRGPDSESDDGSEEESSRSVTTEDSAAFAEGTSAGVVGEPPITEGTAAAEAPAEDRDVTPLAERRQPPESSSPEHEPELAAGESEDARGTIGPGQVPTVVVEEAEETPAVQEHEKDAGEKQETYSDLHLPTERTGNTEPEDQNDSSRVEPGSTAPPEIPRTDDGHEMHHHHQIDSASHQRWEHGQHDTAQREEEGGGSANAARPPSGSGGSPRLRGSPMADRPNDLSGIGAVHESADDEAARKGSAGSIDADFAHTLTTMTTTTVTTADEHEHKHE